MLNLLWHFYQAQGCKFKLPHFVWGQPFEVGSGALYFIYKMFNLMCNSTYAPIWYFLLTPCGSSSICDKNLIMVKQYRYSRVVINVVSLMWDHSIWSCILYYYYISEIGKIYKIVSSLRNYRTECRYYGEVAL